MGLKQMCGLLCLLGVIAFSDMMAQENGGQLKVAILGSGTKHGNETGLYAETLAKVLKRLKEEKPDVVFYTGDLILGLEQSTSVASMHTFEDQLKTFSQLVHTYLGDNIPIHVMMGNHKLVNSEAVSMFREHFRIQDSAPLAAYQLAYVVALGNAQFIVLATGDFERKYAGYQYLLRSMPLLDWLEKTLRSEPDTIKYRFVLGHLPAFSTGYVEGIFRGMDQDVERRNQFWRILQSNGALCYFSSHELLYDRSNRDGVWQVISGGVGNPVDFGDAGNTFIHYCLLMVPKEDTEKPRLKAVGLSGKVWDDYVLEPTSQPVHQLRISRK